MFNAKKDRTGRIAQDVVIGTLEQIRERLVEDQEAGIQELNVLFVDAAQLEPVRIFAREYLQQR